jgi:carbonic anhydrase
MRSRFFGRGLLAAIVFVGLPGFSQVLAQQAPAPWGYTGNDGPKNWGKLSPAYSACSEGRSQSPINIKGAKESDLPALKFDYKAVPLNIIDTGFTIQIAYAPGSTLTVGDKTYSLKQFHFHRPSEDRLNGHRYDMVAHLVHSDAAGHVAVVSIFLQKGQANAFLESVWKNIPSEKKKPIEVAGASVNIGDLLPADHAYYTFAGSLTIPPCTEGVTWYVLKAPVSLSAEQITAFAKFYSDNARPIQSTNGREILETK